MTDVRLCICRHPESKHHRGSCTAIRGAGWDFCPCEAWQEDTADPDQARTGTAGEGGGEV